MEIWTAMSRFSYKIMSKFFGAIFVSVCIFGILHLGVKFIPEHMIWFSEKKIEVRTFMSIAFGFASVYVSPVISGSVAGD